MGMPACRPTAIVTVELGFCYSSKQLLTEGAVCRVAGPCSPKPGGWAGS